MAAPEARPNSMSAALPSRAALHPARKAFHFLTGFIWAVAHQTLPLRWWQLAANGMFMLVFSVEVVRIALPNGQVNRTVLRLFRPFIRASETHEYSGTFYYLFGIVITSLLFNQTSATVGMMCLASLDPIAALAGSLFPQDMQWVRLKNGKSIAGFTFSAFTGILVTFVMFAQADFSTQSPSDAFATAVLIGASGAAVELATPTPRVIFGPKLFPIGVDDNALIPVVSAAVCQWVLKFSSRHVNLAPFLFFGRR